MIFGYFTLFVALLIEVVGAYYSITGLAAIFSGAVVPILIMGGVLELGKVTAAVWLKNNWHRAGYQFKTYLLPAVIMLMLITSMGIFGFLSKAHNDQNLVSGDVLGKIAIYDEKIKIQRDNIDSARRALQQMDAAVDQTMGRSTDEKGADKATAIRRSQARERTNLQNEIARAQGEIVKLNDLRAPIAAEVRKVEAEVGPIKYIAKLIYNDNPDANILEKAVVWMILIIVAVFDPLALVLILAAQQSIRWARGEDTEPKEESKFLERFRDRIRNFRKKEEPKVETNELTQEQLDEINAMAAEYSEQLEPDYTDYSEGTIITEPEPEKKIRFAGFPWPMTSLLNKPNNGVKKKLKSKQPKVEKPVLITRIAYPESNTDLTVVPNAPGLDASDERPGDYLKPDTVEAPQTQIPERPREAAPAPNRGVWTVASAQADNSAQLGKASQTGFGSEFPTNPGRGDVYLRTDYLPNRLFKYNDKKWIEVDKNQTDVYAYDELYIKHLIEEIGAGRYDAESLTDTEREQIQKYLDKNAQ